MDVGEAKARVLRLERLAELVQPLISSCSVAGELHVLFLSVNLTPDVWNGPAADQAYAGLQAALAQKSHAMTEIESLSWMLSRAADVARQVARELGDAAGVAERSGLPVVEDRFAGWPQGWPPPKPPATVPAPERNVPRKPDGVIGYVGINLHAGSELAGALGYVQSECARIQGVLWRMVGESKELSAQLAREVIDLPRTCLDVEWFRPHDRLGLIGTWAEETAKDLRWRLEAIGQGTVTGLNGLSSATLVFADAEASARAAKADGDAIAKIVGRNPMPGIGGVPITSMEDVKDLAGWLEETAEKVEDSGWAGSVVNRLGRKKIHQVIDLAIRGGPEAEARMWELLGRASRSGKLDAKTEAELLRDSNLHRLVESDVELSREFAKKAADALLDPHRPGRDDPMVPGPDPGDLRAALHLMDRYGVGVDMNAKQLDELSGNIYVSADLAAEALRVAVNAKTNIEGSEAQLGRVLQGLESCSDESKRVLAQAVADHIESVARTIQHGDQGAHERDKTIAAIHTLMGDREARETLVNGVGKLAGDRFGQEGCDLAAVMAANPGIQIRDAFDKLSLDSEPLGEVGEMLRSLASWKGDKSAIPGLLSAGFGFAMAAAGTVLTGGAMPIALAGISAAGGVVLSATDAEADNDAKRRTSFNASDVRDLARHLAIASLLTNPGPPPLWSFLVKTPPTNPPYDKLFPRGDGTFVIPEPGSRAWGQLQTWMGQNPLGDAVQELLDRTFAPQP